MSFTTITTHSVASPLQLTQEALPLIAHQDDPARSAMIDFRLTPPATIVRNSSIDAATMQMNRQGTHLLLVSDQNHHIIGLLDSNHLFGERPIQLQKKHGTTRDALTVTQVMTLIDQLPAITIDQVESYQIGHIIATMQHHHQAHLLVIDAQQVLIGLFTAAQLCQQLHQRVCIDL